MSVRSLVLLGLLVVTALASPAGLGNTKTVTVTKTEKAKTVTVTESCSATSAPSGTSSSISKHSKTNPTTTIVATATATNYGLNDAAKATGKLWFGTAADIPGTAELSDKYYMKEFNNTHDFGEATPANIMKVKLT